MKSINFACDEAVLRMQRGAFGGWWLMVAVMVGGVSDMCYVLSSVLLPVFIDLIAYKSTHHLANRAPSS